MKCTVCGKKTDRMEEDELCWGCYEQYDLASDMLWWQSYHKLISDKEFCHELALLKKKFEPKP